MELVPYKSEKKNLKSMYLNKQYRMLAENQKVLSPGFLDILLSQELSLVQRVNLRLPKHKDGALCESPKPVESR